MSYTPESGHIYQGKQVIIDSDRLLFNAKGDSILLFSNKAIGFSTKGSMHIDTSNEKSSKLVINSPNIYLGIENTNTGELPTEPAVLGHELEDLLVELLDFLELFILDAAYNLSGISTLPGSPTGFNPSNGTIVDQRIREIKDIKNNIQNINIFL